MTPKKADQQGNTNSICTYVESQNYILRFKKKKKTRCLIDKVHDWFSRFRALSIFWLGGISAFPILNQFFRKLLIIADFWGSLKGGERDYFSMKVRSTHMRLPCTVLAANLLSMPNRASLISFKDALCPLFSGKSLQPEGV